uniref:DUF159 family protein n=1 Tax=Angiostrongylus cantonensis TaxID=6313 RepID=A0A0K0DN04_ANGCA
MILSGWQLFPRLDDWSIENDAEGEIPPPKQAKDVKAWEKHVFFFFNDDEPPLHIREPSMKV